MARRVSSLLASVPVAPVHLLPANDPLAHRLDQRAFTATLVARLVEQGIIAWRTTVGEVLGDAVPTMQEAYKSINFLPPLSPLRAAGQPSQRRLCAVYSPHARCAGAPRRRAWP